MNWVIENLALAWAAVGVLLLILEVIIFGFGAGFFLFAGIGALITGLLIGAGVAEVSFDQSLLLFSITSVISTAILWPFFKKFQTPQKSQGNGTDYVGQTFILSNPLHRATLSDQRFVGTNWKTSLDPLAEVDELAPGQLVRIVSAEVGRLVVTPT